MIEFPNVSPEVFAFEIGGFELAIRWYALSYIAGFVCALLVMKKYLTLTKYWYRHSPPMSVAEAEDLLFNLILGVILGGRLGYVTFYNLDFYLQNPLDILFIWEGGMSFHGGFIGVVCALILHCNRNNIDFLPAADLLSISTPPGLLFGRLANFVNAELWGKPTTATWGVIFPGDSAQNCPNFTPPCARHPTQLYEAGLEGALLFFVLILIAWRGGLRLPGLLTGVFVGGYAMARFIVEYVRVPDPQFFSEENPYGFAIKIDGVGLTMGQLLSLPMLLVGSWLILYSIMHRR